MAMKTIMAAAARPCKRRGLPRPRHWRIASPKLKPPP